MQKRTIIGIAVGGTIAAVAVTGGITAASMSGDDSEVPITGDALTQATAAALAHLGEGTVTETEEGDEDSYYEVEVTLDDGRQVDVQLDRDFNVVGSEDDGSDEVDD